MDEQINGVFLDKVANMYYNACSNDDAIDARIRTRKY